MNTNRVQKPVEVTGDTRVIIFKAPGSAPERVQEFHNITPHICADQDEADALIAGDGWYATAAEANAARAAAASKPAAAIVSPEVAAILADLKAKTKAECVEYAAGLGVDSKGLTQAQIIEAIGVALSKA